MIKLPKFIQDSVERAIEDALHPGGMRTNGVCRAQVDVTHLQRLLLVALSVQEVHKAAYKKGYDNGLEAGQADSRGMGME